MGNIVQPSGMLEAMKDAEHAMADTLDNSSQSATPSDHDNEGGCNNPWLILYINIIEDQGHGTHIPS